MCCALLGVAELIIIGLIIMAGDGVDHKLVVLSFIVLKRHRLPGFLPERTSGILIAGYGVHYNVEHSFLIRIEGLFVKIVGRCHVSLQLEVTMDLGCLLFLVRHCKLVCHTWAPLFFLRLGATRLVLAT